VTATDGRAALDGWLESGRTVPAFARELVEGVTDHLAQLDEIDDVLETNAEDFVKSFIQKGGQ